jgi:hypothetical protein
MTFVEVTKEDAIAAVRAASWAKQVETCGHTGCEDHIGDGGRYIHVMSGFGMDMPLEQVEAEIRDALQIGWIDHLLDHDLAVKTAEGRIHCYDVKRPVPDGVS